MVARLSDRLQANLFGIFWATKWAFKAHPITQALSNPTCLRPIPPTPTLPNRVTDCLDCSHSLHIPPSSYASALFRLSTLHTRCTLVASDRSTDTRSGHRDIQGLRACCRKHGQASS